MSRAPRTAKTAVPPELAQEIATTQDGRDITQPFVHELRQFKDPRLLAAVDWGVYDRIRKDDQVKACMGQRIGAVVSAEWDVLPGDDQDPRSVKAADDFKAMLGRISWDRITEKMLWVNFNGLAAAELVWRADEFPNLGAGLGFRLKVRHARRFRVDKDNNWRMLTVRNRLGEILPDRKFWMLTAGATDDDEPYGHGLADWLYWPTLFKRNGIRFWNLFLDKFGSPTTVAKYRRGTPKADIAKLLQAIAAMARDSGIAVPEGTDVTQLVAAAGQGASFEQMCRYQDGAIAKIIVGQTMTTDNGSSRSQAEVHAGVALDFKKADADLLSTSFSEGPARWWTDLNYGVDVAAPIVTRSVEEEADLAALASADSTLKGNGWVRTDESFRDTYGDGYERAAEPEPETAKDALQPGSKTDEIVPEDELAKARAKRAANFAAHDPRPLYVFRRLLNAKEVISWAKKQGFTSTLPGADLHVTITYSKRSVDWFKMGAAWGPDATGQLIVPAGGPRAVGKLGENAIVLHFASADLEWRHENMVEAGASWDFPEYRPHVTLTYDGAPADLDAIEPYQGKLVFGPEVFEPIEENWQDGIREARFAEDDRDAVDKVVDDLLAQRGYAPFPSPLKAVIDALAADAANFDEVLLQGLETADANALTQALARAAFATRLEAETA